VRVGLAIAAQARSLTIGQLALVLLTIVVNGSLLNAVLDVAVLLTQSSEVGQSA
jgi:hypothetical protein